MTLVKHKDDPNAADLIVFVHGFTGGRDSFRNSSKIEFYEMLPPDIQEGTNFFSFVYYSKWFDFAPIKRFRGLIPGLSKIFSDGLNRGIDDYASLLTTHYCNYLQRYKKIGFICHSMGGIIVKDFICKLSTKGYRLPAVYVTLATPHKGVEEAKLAELVGHKQAASLRPFSNKILSLAQQWENCSGRAKSRYYCAINDQLVDEYSSFPGNEKEYLFKVEGCHTSICKPEDTSSALMLNLGDFLRDTFKETVKLREETSIESVAFVTYTSPSEPYYYRRDIDTFVEALTKESNIWLWGDPGVGKTTILQRYMVLNSPSFDYIDLSPCPNNSSAEVILNEILDSLIGTHQASSLGRDYCGSNVITQIGKLLINLKRDGCHYIIVDEVPSLSEKESIAFVESISNLVTFYDNSGSRTLKFLVSTRNNPMSDLSGVAKSKFISHFSPLGVKLWSAAELEALLNLIASSLSLGFDEADRKESVMLSEGSPRILKNAVRHYSVYAGIKGYKDLRSAVSMILAEGVR